MSDKTENYYLKKLAKYDFDFHQLCGGSERPFDFRKIPISLFDFGRKSIHQKQEFENIQSH